MKKQLTMGLLMKNSFYTLSGKREERICQKVIIKSVIRRQDCASHSSVSGEHHLFIKGMCPSQSARTTALISL